MPFPEAEISYGGTYAFILTLSNQLKIYNVKPVFQRIFYIPDLGVFQLDEEYRYILGRAEIYFFDQTLINPISILEFLGVEEYVKQRRKKRLDIQDLIDLGVEKIQRAEYQKAVYSHLKEKKHLTDDELLALLNSGVIEYDAEKLLTASKKIETVKVDDRVKDWINAIFKEDIVSRISLSMRFLVDDKYKPKASSQVLGFLPQRTSFKRNIALVVINNARIEVDVKVKVEMDNDKGHYVLYTDLYGNFDIKDAKSRINYGKTKIYVVMVTTATEAQEVKADPEHEEIIEQPPQKKTAKEILAEASKKGDQKAI